MQTIIIFFVSAVMTLLLGRVLLPMLIRLKVGQAIRTDGPQKHLTKAGTPTMGGIIFIAAALLLSIFMANLQPMLWVWLFGFLSFGLIGFVDDYAKLRRRHNKGMSGRQKLLAQFVAAAILLLLNGWLMDSDTILYFPYGRVICDLGWFYYPLIAVFIVGMVNAVNLTDGLDGLASGVSMIVFIGFAIVGSAGIAAIPALAQYPWIAAMMGGCCLGFLVYNRYPARVFMGDTGSMALGGAVVGLALVAQLEVVLLGFGLVYLAEAFCVMLQVGYFKLTHGKRLFLMAPLHHHFELKGWKETKVTAIFCLAAAVAVCLTLIIYTLAK